MNRGMVRIYCASGARKPEPSSPNSLLLPAFALSPDGHKIKLPIAPHTPKLIRTGLSIEYAEGLVPFLMSRSSSAKRSLIVVNSPFAVNKGEVSFVLQNNGLETQYIEHGDLLACLVFLSGAQVGFEVK